MEQILAYKPNISDSTKRTYQQTFKRAIKTFKKPLDEMTPTDICTAVDVMISKGDNINTVKATLNICILFYQSTGKYENDLVDKRNSLNGILNEYVKEQKRQKLDTLVDYSTLCSAMLKEYKLKNWRNYIVQYLFLCYAFRNKDINLKIVKVTRDTLEDTSTNYMVTNIIKNKQFIIKLIINNYKTASTYGQKIIIITDQTFVKATRAFVKNKTWLLTDKDKPLSDDSLACRIQAFTYNRTTESDYFKSCIIWANTQQHTTTLLKEFSKTRGTDINTILNSYDCDEKSI